jgi:hypothetical protein
MLLLPRHRWQALHYRMRDLSFSQDPCLTDKSEACPSTLLRQVYTLFGTTVFQGG